MQFYIIHEDPKINAELLPDYALKRVNIREGWQMLSDIGHAHGVTWPDQNKEYNRYHPNTWQFWKTKNDFTKFILYYATALREYYKRFKKQTKFHEYFYSNFFVIDSITHKIKDMDKYELIKSYMLNRKSKFLTDEEIKKLQR